MFSTTFHVISPKVRLLFGQRTGTVLYGRGQLGSIWWKTCCLQPFSFLAVIILWQNIFILRVHFCFVFLHPTETLGFVTVFVLYRITVLRTHCGEAPGRDSNQGGLKRQGHWPLTTLYSTAQNTGHWQSKKIEHTVGIQSYDVATNTTQSTHTIYTSRAENVLTMLWTHAVKDTIQL